MDLNQSVNVRKAANLKICSQCVYFNLFSLSVLYPTTAVVCDELPAINNGIILYQPDMSAQFDLGTVATYSCNEGYQLITNPGDEIRTCVDGGDGNGGVFNGAKPICECKERLAFSYLLLPLQYQVA